MNAYKTVELGSACELVMGQSPSSDTYNSDGIGLPFFQGNADFGEEHPTPSTWCSEPKKTARKGDILISVRAPIGAVNTATEECCIGRGVAALRPDKNLLNAAFLKYHLIAKRPELERAGTGSTFTAVGKKALSKLEVRLFSLGDQIEMSRRLDILSENIHTAREQLTMLDYLVKSRFIELFGDPVSNSKALPTQTLASVAPIEGDSMPKSGAVWLLNLDAIESGTGRILRNEMTEAQDTKSSIIAFSERHVLISKLRPYLNKVVIPHSAGICTSELLPLLPNKDYLTQVYLAYTLRSDSFVRFISQHVAGAKMPRIDLRAFKSFEIPIPEMSSQLGFEDFVTQVDKLRFDDIVVLRLYLKRYRDKYTFYT